MLIVETPDTRRPERDYITRVVLGEFLGLQWIRKTTDRRDVRITSSESLSGAVTLPDMLFQVAEANWLKSESQPAQPLVRWNADELGISARLVDSTLPIIYGDSQPVLSRSTDQLHLPIDIFGSAFFMLTRYEEMVKPDRDEHDRFPAWASLAYQEGFLERPIIDEYVEVLWSAIYSLWPNLQRKERSFQIKVSHDVDRPSRYGFGSTRQFLRAVGGDVVKRGAIGSALRAPSIRRTTRTHLHRDDPYNTFDWIMDRSDRAGLQSAFYFICGRTDPRKDAQYEPDHPAIRKLMRRIHERGHEIGLHPSYNTYRNPKALAAEAQRLRKICAEEDIFQSEWGGRMHYLRWEQPKTLGAWAKAGMTYDSTLGYADHAGFRCGTCVEYSAFDPSVGEPIKLLIRPLVAMECTVMSPRYMAVSDTFNVIESFEKLRNACNKIHGCFTLLWHNSELVSETSRRIYAKLL